MTTPAVSRRTLSKSDFKLARSCDAKLYFRENGYPDSSDMNPYLALLAQGGYMVEALAKATHADGIELGYGGEVAEDSARTLEHLQRENVTLFEATLLVGRRQARVDILEKRGNVVRLLEVKAKSLDGAEHAASLADGKKGALRGVRKPHNIRAEWAEKLEDVTFQTILLEQLRPDLVVKPYLVLVDTAKHAARDDVPGMFALVERERNGRRLLHTARFVGDRTALDDLDLVTEIDVSEEVAMLRESVDAAAARYETLLDAPLSAYTRALGAACAKCEFRLDDAAERHGFGECWGPLAAARPHMLELYSVSKAKTSDGSSLVDTMLQNNTASLLDVPLDGFEIKPEKPGAVGNRQRRQVEHTRAGSIWWSDDLRREIDRLDGRLHFIDFETSRLALPYHRGMRPYGLVAFQWSCHVAGGSGATSPSHMEWLNASDVWPNHAFVESLRGAIGDEGPVLTWSHFEASTLKQIVGELTRFGFDAPEMVEWVTDVVERRVVDMHDWARCHYYNPGMRGRTSIKVVLDALWQSDARMREQFSEWTGRSPDGALDPYHTLPSVEIAGTPQDVHEGTGAMRAYQEMMYGAHKADESVKAKWAALLKQYCALDTLSMVLILEHWRRLVGASR